MHTSNPFVLAYDPYTLNTYIYQLINLIFYFAVGDGKQTISVVIWTNFCAHIYPHIEVAVHFWLVVVGWT